MASAIQGAKRPRAREIGAVNEGGVKESRICINLLANIIDQGRRRALEIEDLVASASWIEYGIALGHRDIEYFGRIGDTGQDHVVIDDVAPVPDETRNVDAVWD